MPQCWPRSCRATSPASPPDTGPKQPPASGRRFQQTGVTHDHLCPHPRRLPRRLVLRRPHRRAAREGAPGAELHAHRRRRTRTPRAAGVNLETHITDVLAALEAEPEVDDLVLVGHSYGGMVITGVADRIPERSMRWCISTPSFPVTANRAGTWSPTRNGSGTSESTRPATACHRCRSSTQRASAHPLASFLQRITLTGDLNRFRRRDFVYALKWPGDSPLRTSYERVKDDPNWTRHELDGAHNLMRRQSRRPPTHPAGSSMGECGTAPTHRPDPRKLEHVSVSRREIGTLTQRVSFYATRDRRVVRHRRLRAALPDRRQVPSVRHLCLPAAGEQLPQPRLRQRRPGPGTAVAPRHDLELHREPVSPARRRIPRRILSSRSRLPRCSWPTKA